MPWREADNSVSGWVASVYDISARKRAEAGLGAVNDELRVPNAELSRANQDLNQFAFAASHDLQEPLRMITSSSQLLLKSYRGQLDDKASTWVQFMTDGTQRMRELLADLLTYTQLANDRQETAKPVDLGRVFQMVVENCKPAIDETKATVTRDALPTIPGGRSRIAFSSCRTSSARASNSAPPAGRHGFRYPRKCKTACGASL